MRHLALALFLTNVPPRGASFGDSEGSTRLISKKSETPAARRRHLHTLRVLHIVMCTAKDSDWRQLHRMTWIASTKRGLRSTYHAVMVDVRFMVRLLLYFDRAAFTLALLSDRNPGTRKHQAGKCYLW
jgi:hypothetical protein